MYSSLRRLSATYCASFEETRGSLVLENCVMKPAFDRMLSHSQGPSYHPLLCSLGMFCAV